MAARVFNRSWVKPRHHQRVVGVELVERAAELAHLGVNTLAVHRDARIPVNYGLIRYAPNFRNGKALRFQASGFGSKLFRYEPYACGHAPG